MSNLKSIVFDIDSIDFSYEIEWQLLSKDWNVLIITEQNELLVNQIIEENPNVKIIKGVRFHSIDILRNIHCIRKIREYLKLPVHNFAIVTGSKNIIKTLQKFPINVIEFTSNTYKDPLEDYKNLADFTVNNLEELEDVFDRMNVGYYSEFASLQNQLNEENRRSCALLVRKLKTTSNNFVSVVAGGRYFTTSDPRSYSHLLSHRILWNKNKGKNQNQLFLTIYKGLLTYINDNIGAIDSICYIPSRPQDLPYDRFKLLNNQLCRELNKANISELFYCNQDYRRQKGLESSQRFENVKGVFSSIGDTKKIKDKHIVILDDVFVTGATSFAFSDLIYKLGARKVTIAVLAQNQLNITESKNFGFIRCECGAKMVARVNMNRNLVCFFGCSDFKDKSKRHITLDYRDGLQRLSEVNEQLIENNSYNDVEILF